MTRILSSDILVADMIVSLEGNEKLQALVEKYQITTAGSGKKALSKEQFDEISRAVEGHPITIQPGGSSANVLTTLSKLLPEVDVQLIGVTGGSMYSSMIRQSLAEAGVTLLPETLPEGKPSPKTAVSYVIMFPNGKRAIVTYPGNAKDILTPDIITDDLVRQSDVLLVQGSLWQKLHWGFADKLLDLRWKHHKELWLALPTHAEFGEEKAGHFQWLLTSANVVMGNEEELARIYHTSPQAALSCLQNTFRHHKVLEREGRQRRKPVGFITRGKEGAAIVTEDGIEYVKPARIEKEEIVNELGAGDTAFSGFAAGYLKGLPHHHSAQLAMTLAAEKLKINGARLPDPGRALRDAAPHLADVLLG